MTATHRAMLEAELAALDGEPSEARIERLNDLALSLITSEPQRAESLVKESLAASRAIGYERGHAYALGFLGYAKYVQSAHEEARRHLVAARPMLEELGDIGGVAMVIGALASIELSLGNYEPALSHGLHALRLQRATGDREQEGWSLNGIGVGYTELGDLERARQYHEEALELFEQIGNADGIGRALTGLGTVLQQEGKFKEALPLHERSLAAFRKTNNRLGESRAVTDLGTAYHGLGEHEHAIELLKQSLALRQELNSPQAQSTTLLNLGQVYVDLGDLPVAIDYLRRALAMADELGVEPKKYRIHRALAEAFEKGGNLERALYHFKAFHSIRETVNGEEIQARMTRLQVQYEMEQAAKHASIIQEKNDELAAKNERLQTILQDLQAAQQQLIHAEKMALLGQLTAGIAHEIKNPLNFVNNFARLSVELADDLLGILDEVHNASSRVLSDEQEGEVRELTADVQFNARKIMEHGQRADRIVQSMMQHARGRTGERKPTDVNALLDEHVNLAYHGIRAQRPTFNVTLKRDYDDAVGAMNVVSQDLARVFLNLLANAFHAVDDRVRTANASYEPTVWVETAVENGSLRVSIRDNGTGIPASIQDRIFEPFFTTKPAGMGTGLGLSLSYEILTKGHRGTLTVDSSEGEGSAFTLTIPRTESADEEAPASTQNGAV